MVDAQIPRQSLFQTDPIPKDVFTFGGFRSAIHAIANRTFFFESERARRKAETFKLEVEALHGLAYRDGVALENLASALVIMREAGVPSEVIQSMVVRDVNRVLLTAHYVQTIRGHMESGAIIDAAVLTTREGAPRMYGEPPYADETGYEFEDDDYGQLDVQRSDGELEDSEEDSDEYDYVDEEEDDIDADTYAEFEVQEEDFGEVRDMDEPGSAGYDDPESRSQVRRGKGSAAEE